jgi:1-acyl-sn-glycerol-3-phosphate acyltransferase
MITAQHSPIWKKMLGWYFFKRLKKAFFRGYIRGEINVFDAIEEQKKEYIPIVFYCTHFSWWDAIITIVLSLKTFQLHAIGMMEERQLKRYGFFRKIGMFSVQGDNPLSSLRSLQYASDELRKNAQALWMFPQGTLRNQELMPLNLQPGLSILLKKSKKLLLVPIAIQYYFLREEQPECFISIGAGTVMEWNDSTKLPDVTKQLEEILTEENSQLKETILQQQYSDFSILFQGKMSIEKKYDQLRGIPQ